MIFVAVLAADAVQKNLCFHVFYAGLLERFEMALEEMQATYAEVPWMRLDIAWISAAQSCVFMLPP